MNRAEVLVAQVLARKKYENGSTTREEWLQTCRRLLDGVDSTCHDNPSFRIRSGNVDDMIPPCSCPEPGYCQRHLMQKTEKQWQQCRTKPTMRGSLDVRNGVISHEQYRQFMEYRNSLAWRCPKCGVVAERTPHGPVLCVCGYLDESGELTPVTEPHLSRRLVYYGEAVSRWIAAGQPTRTDEDVQTILAICLACDKFTGKKCLMCGCRINDKEGGLFNKARMATEHCPVEYW